MAAKKKDKLDRLTDLVKAQGRTLKVILEHTAHLTEEVTLVKGIVTSSAEQITSINSELRGIQAELRDIRNRLDALDTKAASVDELRARIAAIEKHLGINKKIAA